MYNFDIRIRAMGSSTKKSYIKKSILVSSLMVLLGLIPVAVQAESMIILDTVDPLDRMYGLLFTSSNVNGNQIADYFHLDSKTSMTSLTWSGLANYSIISDGKADFVIRVFADENGQPATYPLREITVSATGIDTGQNLYESGTSFVFHYDTDGICDLEPGNYWLSILGPGTNGFGWAIEKDRIGTIYGSGGAIRTNENSPWHPVNDGVTFMQCRGYSLCIKGNVVGSVPSPPQADAGPDQTVNAWVDGKAYVSLDASRSISPNDAPLTYKWSWTINGITYQAQGEYPNIQLPAGRHTIQLIVNDGYSNSAPAQMHVTVIPPLQQKLTIYPSTLKRVDWFVINTMATMTLPSGIAKTDIRNQQFLLYPAGSTQSVKGSLYYFQKNAYACILFKRLDIMKAIPDNGKFTVYVVGQLNSGRYFFGSDTVTIYP